MHTDMRQAFVFFGHRAGILGHALSGLGAPSDASGLGAPSGLGGPSGLGSPSTRSPSGLGRASDDIIASCSHR